MKHFYLSMLAVAFSITAFSQTTVQVQITESTDDVEEYIDTDGQTQTPGSLDITSSDLELGSEDPGGVDPQLVGLRFPGLEVPANAVILSASIQFTQDETKEDVDGQYVIRVVRDPNPETFDGTIPFDVSARETMPATVDWSIPAGTWLETGESGPDQRTPDLAALVQRVVMQDGWESGNAIVFTIEGTGTKAAESSDGDAAGAPVLSVTYIDPVMLSYQVRAEDDDQEEKIVDGSQDPGSSDLELGSEEEDGSAPQLVGVRFQGIELPDNAVVTYASIQFTQDETKIDDTASLVIRGEASPNAGAFTSDANNISGRPTTDTSVDWFIPSGTWLETGEAGPDQRTPNIADIVNEIASQEEWTSGNSMVFTIEGTGTKVAESFEGDAAGAAVLNINYVLVEQQEYQIAGSTDDSEERISTGAQDITSSDLELGSEEEDGSAPQLVGMRFTGIDIEQGAPVGAAFVQFTVDELKIDASASLVIRAEASADAQTFSEEAFNISSRPTFDATVEWEIPEGTWLEAGESGEDQRTPNIAALIQEVVNQEDWMPGNSIVLTIEGTGTKVAESFDGDAAAAPVLEINLLSDPNEGDMTVLPECDDSAPQGDKREFVLDPVSQYATGVFDEGAAEIAAFDPASQRLFFTNADANSVTILDMSDPENPTLIDEVNMDAFGGGVNSLDVFAGNVAVAVEADSTPVNGAVVILDISGTPLVSYEVGVLPDMLTFTEDGTKILTANEGQPAEDYSSDPEGSVSIIDVSSGITTGTVTNVTFESFNDRAESLKNRGVRIFGPEESFPTVAQDLEPEYIAIVGNTAYVACQENNALAIIDIEAATCIDIIALGEKNYNSGRPRLTEFVLNEILDLPALGQPVYDGGQDTVFLGGFSGLYFDPTQSTDDSYVFYAVPDRGPNDGAVSAGDVTPAPPGNLRPFKLPDYQGRISKFTVNTSGTVSYDGDVLLTQKDGVTPITGRGNIPGFDEVPVTYADPATNWPNVDYTDGSGEEYHALEYDPFGGDFEGVLRDPAGNFWMCDEYRPAVYAFDPNGVLIERYVPMGTSMLGDSSQPVGTYGAETLPAYYSNRRANRGFEAIALDTDSLVLYSFIQSPLYNPDNSTRNNSDVIRILGIDPTNGVPVAEYVYLLERNRDDGVGLNRVDKIGDAVYVGNGKFWVLERDSSVPGEDEGKKYVFEINLTGATNILGTDIATDPTNTLELMTADEIVAAGVTPVHKTKILNLPSVGYLPSDKPEGIALLPDGSMAVLNDNDFGLAGAGVSDNSSLGIITFCEDNAIDASNRSDAIDIRNWPVLSYFMPDAIKSYVAADGKGYIVSANEGDARDYDGYSEEERVGGLTLDPVAYPNADNLQLDENLGRLLSTTANGDFDDDGDVDQIYGYGARSFSIWDAFGNLVYDSGNEFARIIEQLNPDNFNSNNDDNDSQKSRSDDKGTEPEAIEIAVKGDSIYALIGLERQGGIMVYNITDPKWPYFVTYFTTRNFDVDATDPAAGDLGPEDIIFVPAEDSPNGQPLVITANEVSGTIGVYGVTFDKTGFLVRLIHKNDGESKIAPQEITDDGVVRMIGGAAPFKTAVDSLRGTGTPNIMLSSGDNFLASVAFNASLNLPDDRSFYDAVVVDSLDYDAICIGNHDFDFGPDILARVINDVKVTQPPYLSANLDFSDEPNLQALVSSGRIASRTIVDVDGEQVGVIGLITPRLPTISSPRNVTVDSNLVAIVQGEVDALEMEGVNKIILISHLQSINDEKELATEIQGVDVIISGGGDELLTNDENNAIPGVSIQGEYPQKVTDSNGDTVFIVTTPGEYRYVGNLLVEFDDDGTVFDINQESDVILIEGFAADPGLQASVVDSVLAFEANLDKIVVGRTEVDLDGTREGVRTRETNQGNLITDAFLWYADNIRDSEGLDPSIPIVAVQNGGGIRNNIIVPANSDLTQKVTFDMLPFSNGMSIINPMSPELVKSMMENAVSAIENVDGKFLQIAGFSVIYDMSGTPDVDRVVSITLDDGTKIVEDGALVAGAPAIYIMTNSFTAAGGDDFDEFVTAGSKLLGGDYWAVLNDFIMSEDGLNAVVTAEDYPVGGEGRIQEASTVSTEYVDLGQISLATNPNPFNEGLFVSYMLEQAEDVRMQLIDMMGRTVYTAVSTKQPAGEHNFRIDASAIPSGMYTLFVQLGDKVAAKQVVKN